MKIILKKISAESTISIRQQVLREGKPLESCYFDGDLLASTFHIGLFCDNILVGIISVYKKNAPLFIDENQYQIRGMAVLKDFQKRSFGEQLVAHVENTLRPLKCNLIWFNARISAIGFYEKMNYAQVGFSFTIENVGEHVVMFKKL